MALALPQFASLDGRAQASSADANVTVWPYTKNGEYDLNQRSLPTRAATTITAAPDAKAAGAVPNGTVTVEWNGVFYFLPFNTSITVPLQVYTILTTSGSNYTVT